jgi:hypothetical protein
LISSVSLHLLTQDNSVPGNRKDGFRFHHLLFVIFSTPLYLWFELAFGVSLLDGMSGHVVIDDTHAIEHWGRLISGAAVALLFLSGWVRHWEREALHWSKGLAVCAGIVLVSVFVTWWVQGKVLEFYVERTNAEIPWAAGSLVFLIVSGFLLMRLWLHKARSQTRAKYLWISLGVLLLLLLGYAQIMLIKSINPLREQQLGIERQQTATLTIVRRGLQEGVYEVPDTDYDRRALASAEGKAFLSLFPIFGSVYDQQRLAEDRPRLIAEFMFRDWLEQFGDQTYAGYKTIESDLVQKYQTDYLAASKSVMIGDQTMPPRLSRGQFEAHPVVKRYLRKELACFDCNYTMGMTKDDFSREFYTNSKKNDVAEAVKTFADPQNFEQGRNGNRAARTYWAPILALLFSMLGAFTHLFKLLVTVTAYFHRLTFDRIDAADSPMANDVIVNGNRVTAVAICCLALFVYFSDNRITGNESYIAARAKLWQERPIAGAIAAHWTVNAQAISYPFTRKIKPDWLQFGSDPVMVIPIVKDWFVNDQYE